ncbi:MAG: carboxylesterase/lipase family protein [Promethearchaeota archaeon]
MEKTRIIETKIGKVQGIIEKNTEIFRGIPYAEKPVGELRFKHPSPPKKWDGILQADDFGPNAPQPSSSAKWLFGPDREYNEEECLTLNIWTPKTDDQKRPVMFWIHGGNYAFGNSAQANYDGIPLAKRGDIVIVTINYRLGPLGFLDLPNIDKNIGLADCIMALSWVHKNIEYFGGDPNNVTIFGESAGGNAVITLLTMPKAKGLFHKVIAQSTAIYYSSDQKLGSKDLLSKLKLETDDLTVLREIPVKKIIRAHNKMIFEYMQSNKSTAFIPTVDQDLIPENPIKMISNGYAKDIPLLIGTNKDEVKFMQALIPNPTDYDSNNLISDVSRVLSDLNEDDKKAEDLINAYIEGRKDKLSTEPLEIRDAIMTDIVFRILSTRLAEIHKKYQPNTYMYLFEWPSPWMDGKLGAPHAIEVSFAFGTCDKPGTEVYCGKGKDVDELSSKVMDSWISFAKTGNPNHENIPNWPQYDSEKRATLIFDKNIKVVNAPLELERKTWDDIDISLI